MSRYVAFCYVMSRHVTSCHVMSRHVTSCHVMSHHVISRNVTSCHVTSCHILPRHVTSCHIMLRHITSKATLHCQLTSSTRNQFKLSMTVFVGFPEGCRYNTASAVYHLVFICSTDDLGIYNPRRDERSGKPSSKPCAMIKPRRIMAAVQTWIKIRESNALTLP